MVKLPNKQIKRMERGWVLSEKQNQIAVVGRYFSSPPLIANRYTETIHAKRND